jgi:DNA-dependent protein kinase catalytic subunit
MDVELNAPAWYPQQKIEIAKRKLLGENPVGQFTYFMNAFNHSFLSLAILLHELSVAHEKKRFYHDLQNVVRGDPQFNVRATIGTTCANVKEQADCLLDLAMDPNVLGRSWLGWSPHV